MKTQDLMREQEAATALVQKRLEAIGLHPTVTQLPDSARGTLLTLPDGKTVLVRIPSVGERKIIWIGDAPGKGDRIHPEPHFNRWIAVVDPRTSDPVVYVVPQGVIEGELSHVSGVRVPSGLSGTKVVKTTLLDGPFRPEDYTKGFAGRWKERWLEKWEQLQ